MDWKTELDAALELHAQVQQDVRTAADRLHLAGIHLTNVQAILNKPTRDRTPLIEKFFFENVAGVTITTDSAPSDTKDALTRDLLVLVGGMGFNTTRFLMNHQEAQKQWTLLKQDHRDCLLTVAKASGLVVIADTVELMVPDYVVASATLTAAAAKTKNAEIDAKVNLYFTTLKALGVRALYVNDADRAALKPKLEGIVARIRAASDLPLLCSLNANASLDYYRKLFDHVEVQTFGSVDETKRHIGLPAIPCLDGQRSATPLYLNAILPVVLDAEKDALFVYTAYDRRTNWQNMPETVRIYTDFLNKWWAQRGVPE